ncbi:rhodanese-like domain-containing protein [Microaceticoccus formicicus]|uniref:rhodanese-like domain-containing protein n=1 Tax=Microaceticoccus formicicus TaxID=3118105 RepID=UPI003CD02C98|nr:rhodanese-like domain-containing protein [Peptoniphilaceae bacterium AMB_02]
MEKCEEHEIYTLDVRKEEEYLESDKLKGRINIPLQELKNRIKELDGIGTVYVVCRSSLRASIAASYIEANTDTVPIVVLGGMLALDSVR